MLSSPYALHSRNKTGEKLRKTPFALISIVILVIPPCAENIFSPLKVFLFHTSRDDSCPDCRWVQCLKLRKTSCSVPNVHLMLIIYLSLKFALSLPMLSFSSAVRFSNSSPFPTLLLNVSNYCVSTFPILHSAPHRRNHANGTVNT